MIGIRIAALRREAGLSQAQLARKLQISPSAMGMYEQGRREPSLQLLGDMAKVLGVSTDYLITGNPPPEDSETVEQLLTGRIRSAEQRLSARPDRPFSRQEMLEHVWKYDYTGDARTVDVHIRRLREKIERNTNQPEFILTKWKVGYYFTDQD